MRLWVLLASYLLVFASGFTGLVYQVIWQKYLSMYLGGHASATALVLSGFFFYLAIGYFVVGRLSSSLAKNKLILYGALELIIGAYSLVSPDYFYWLKDQFLTSHLASGFLTDFAFTSLFIAVPTFMMGGTIPVLTEGLSTEFQESHKVHAYVYGVNTAGAFLGAVLCGFYFIESFGLPMTLMLGGVTNILIFFAAYVIAAVSRLSFSGPQLNPQPTQLTLWVRWLLYGMSALSGFYVFSLETLLIRMAGISLGSSVYTYSMIVAAFIIAIAAGSLLISRTDPGRRPRIMPFIQCLLFLTSLVLYLSVPFWPDLFLRLRIAIQPSLLNFDLYCWLTMFAFIIILIIPVGLMGMNLPLLFGYLRQKNEHLSSAVGRLYAANSIGSVLGAAVGGYLLFNLLNAAEIFRLNLGLMLLGYVILSLLVSETQRIKKFQLITAAGFMVLVATIPSWELSRFIPTRATFGYPEAGQSSFSKYLAGFRLETSKILFYRDDPNTSVSVSELASADSSRAFSRPIRSLNVNAKSDATYPGDELPRAFLPLLATSLAPRVQRVFIAGLGAGLSTAIVTHLSEVEEVEVAEISSGVIEALPYFRKFNLGLDEHSSKFHFYRGDAYKRLMSTDKKYNIIMSEPSNPWVAGVDKLFTIEYFSQAAKHLEEDGVFALWFPIGSVSEESFATILRTLNQVFPYISVWNSAPGTVSLLASLQDITPEQARLNRRFSENADFFKMIFIDDPLTILGMQLLPPGTIHAFAKMGNDIHSLEFPSLTYTAARTLFAQSGARIDTFVENRLLIPVAENDKTTMFFYERLDSPAPPAFYSNVERRYRKIGQSTSPSFYLRWQYAKQRWAPEQQRPHRPDTQWLEMILGERELPKATNSAAQLKLGQRLISAYQVAKQVHLHPKFDILLSALDLDCRSEDCLNLAFAVLKQRVSPKDPLFLAAARFTDPKFADEVLARLKALKNTH